MITVRFWESSGGLAWSRYWRPVNVCSSIVNDEGYLRSEFLIRTVPTDAVQSECSVKQTQPEMLRLRVHSPLSTPGTHNYYPEFLMRISMGALVQVTREVVRWS